jgi:hypothetical protein
MLVSTTSREPRQFSLLWMRPTTRREMQRAQGQPENCLFFDVCGALYSTPPFEIHKRMGRSKYSVTTDLPLWWQLRAWQALRGGGEGFDAPL